MMPTSSIRKEILKQKEEEVGRLRSENTALSIEVGMLKKKLDETESSFRYDFLLFKNAFVEKSGFQSTEWKQSGSDS
jgi:hypothetical protein